MRRPPDPREPAPSRGALSELRARLLLEGLSDEEAAALAIRLEPEVFVSMELSTWRTDAGHLDALGGISAYTRVAAVSLTNALRMRDDRDLPAPSWAGWGLADGRNGEYGPVVMGNQPS